MAECFSSVRYFSISRCIRIELSYEFRQHLGFFLSYVALSLSLSLSLSLLQVADGEVIYRDISIEGPNGIIRTSPPTDEDGGSNEGTCSVDTATVRAACRAS